MLTASENKRSVFFARTGILIGGHMDAEDEGKCTAYQDEADEKDEDEKDDDEDEDKDKYEVEHEDGYEDEGDDGTQQRTIR